MLALVAVVATVICAVSVNYSYALHSWLVWRVLLLWAYNAVLFAAFLSIGHLLVARVLRLELPTLEMLVTSTAAGVVAFGLLMVLGGFLGWFNLPFAIALPSILIAVGARSVVRCYRPRFAAWRQAAEADPPATRLNRAIWVVAIAFGTLSLTLVYLPLLSPSSLNFDAVWCHLTISQDYAKAGRIIPFDGDYARNVVQFAPLIHTWGWLLPMTGRLQRWTMPLHTEFFFLLWTLGGIAAAVRYVLNGEQVRGIWVVFFLFPAIFVYDANLGGAADHVAAFFAPPFFLCVLRTLRRFDARTLTLCGWLGGAILITKYQGGFLLAGALLLLAGAWLRRLWLMWRARRARSPDGGPPEPNEQEQAPTARQLLLRPLIALGLFGVVVAPHFIRNWAFHGNPFYPFAQDVFASTPTVDNASYLVENLFKEYRARPRGTLLERVATSVRLVFTFSLEPHYSFTKKWPNFGFLFTCCLPMLLFVRDSKRIWQGVVVALGALLMWAFTFRVDRNLQVFAPILVIVTAAIFVRVWQVHWIARFGLLPIVALQVIWGGDAMVYSLRRPIHNSLDLIASGFDDQLQRRSEFRSQYTQLDHELPPDARVVLHMQRGSLGLERKIVLDWPGQQGLLSYEGLAGPKQLREVYERHEISHLLYLPDHRPAWSRYADVLFEDLIRYYPRRKVGDLMLVTLSERSLPSDPKSYRVVTIDMLDYADGSYELSAVAVMDFLPKHLRHYPPPENPLPPDDAGRVRMVKAARAVLVGPAGVSPAVAKPLEMYFEQVRTYERKKKTFDLYLRKRLAIRL